VPLTTLDTARGELSHRWPQALPGGRFLYLVRSGKPENAGVYATSLAKPQVRVRLLSTDTNVLYAPGGDGRDYLLWMRGGALVAQEFNLSTLELAGEPRVVADPVATSVPVGLLLLAVVSLAAQAPISYGVEKGAALGKQLAEEFLRHATRIDNPVVQNYLDRLGQRLAAQMPEASFPFTFRAVVDDRCSTTHEPTALPGGYVFVPT